MPICSRDDDALLRLGVQRSPVRWYDPKLKLWISQNLVAHAALREQIFDSIVVVLESTIVGEQVVGWTACLSSDERKVDGYADVGEVLVTEAEDWVVRIDDPSMEAGFARGDFCLGGEADGGHLRR